MHGLPDGWMVKRVRASGRDVTYTPASLATGANQIEVTITNRLARPVVHVRGAEGEAVTDARVLALPAIAKPWRTPLGGTDGRPAADGSITLGPLPPGDYLFVALSLGDLNVVFYDQSRLPSLAEIGTMVTLKENESPTIDLRLARLPEKR
jgi:hypothetical protein